MSLTLTIMLRWMNASMCMSMGVYQSRLKTLVKNKQSIILMYHRVLSPAHTNEYVEPGMYVTPTTFKMHLTLLRKYFEVVSLRELTIIPYAKSEKPLCAITFDDGWFDLYTNAFTLLKESRFPVTVFIPTDFIGTEKRFWTDRLAEIIKRLPGSTHKNQNSSFPDRIAQYTGSLFSRIDNAIKLLKPCPLEQVNGILQELETRVGKKSLSQQRAFLNWEECREMKKSSLVTFGSHTANHSILTSESEEICKKELEISRKKLIEEHVVESSFIPFCYPNGNFTSNTIAFVNEAGYDCAVTTRRGYVNETSNRCTLNRMGMHEDMTRSKSLVLAQLLK